MQSDTKQRPAQDGRSARSELGRRKVGEALVALVSELGSMPDVALVAERAGVGRATVFRYFDSVARLEVETARVMRRIAFTRLPLPEPEGTLDERVAALIAHRAAFYEWVTPVRRFLDAARSRGNAEIDAAIAEARDIMRSNVQHMFAAELANNPDVIEAISLVTSWEAWHALREGQRLPVDSAASQVRALLALVLAR